MSIVCDIEKSEMKVCVFASLHVEGAPITFQWHGRTIVSDHLPCDDLESTRVLRSKDMNSCQCECAIRECAENVPAVQCLSTFSGPRPHKQQ